MEQNFNVGVIGLSGSNENGVEFKVGKSLLCNRFVRSAKDELFLNHESVFSQECIDGDVIKNDNFLYWGSLSMRTESSHQVLFNVVEFTELRTKKFSPFVLQSYLKKSIVPKIYIKDKLMYICEDQVKNPLNYPQEKFSNSSYLDIHGYLVVISAEPNAFFKNQQIFFLIESLKAIKFLNIPVLIVVTKFDEVNQEADFYDFLMGNIKKLYPDCILTTPFIETSALLNVNIVSAFQILYKIAFKKEKSPKIRKYSDAFRTVEIRNSTLMEGFSSLILFSKEKILTISFNKFLEINKNSPKVKNLIRIIGKEGTSDFFEICKVKREKRLKERMLQYCLSIFETFISQIIKNPESITTDPQNIEDFISYIRTSDLFNKFFQDQETDWSDSDNLETFCECLNKIEKNGVPLKIPSNMLLNERFSVVLATHKTKIHLLSQKKLKKDELITIFDQLIENHTSKTQIVTEISKIVVDDNRFNNFSSPLLKLRDNWIFTFHTFLQSDTFCLLSPMSTCFDKIAKNILSSFFQHFDGSVDNGFDSSILIIFVISLEKIFNDFEKEFEKFANSASDLSFNLIHFNGRIRNVLLVKISEQLINWTEIFSKYSNHKFSFIGLYYDATSYNFVESCLIGLNNFFQEKFKDKNQASVNSIKHIEKVSESMAQGYGVSLLNNIAVIFCLDPCVINEYKKFLASVDNNVFFQESMLGRLVEQGRNLCLKYSAKFIEPYLEEILNNDLTASLHEFQVVDSIKYLEEIVYERPELHAFNNNSEININILVCCMCGDRYSLELVMGILLYGRKYEYSYKREVVYITFKNEDHNYTITLKIASYHSAFIISRRELYHGCITIFSMERECSYKVMSSFISRSSINFFHVLGISGQSSRSKIEIQKSFELNELLKINREQLEKKEPCDSNDTMSQTREFNKFLKLCCHFVASDPYFSKTQLNIYDKLQNSTYGRKKFGTFQFQMKKEHDTFSLLSPKTILSDTKSTVSWSDNPSYSRIQDQSKITKVESMKFSSTKDIRFQSKSIPDRIIPTFKNIGNFIFNQKKAAIKVINLFKNKAISVQSSQRKDPMFSPFDKIKQPSPDMISTDSNKQRFSFPYRIVNAFSSKAKQADLNDKKMREWEEKLNKKNEDDKHNYFGKDLSTVFSIDDVPYFVIKCILFIELNGLEIEGIYRRSGSKNDLETLIMAFEAGFFYLILDKYIDFSCLGLNIHTFTSSLKTYFSMLPYSIIPSTYIEPILEASSIISLNTDQSDPQIRIERFKKIADLLPINSKKTLTFLIHHLSRVSKASEFNKMDAGNLAIIFWPTLLKLPTNINAKIINGCHPMLCLFFRTMIENVNEILGKSLNISLKDLSIFIKRENSTSKTIQRSVSIGSFNDS